MRKYRRTGYNTRLGTMVNAANAIGGMYRAYRARSTALAARGRGLGSLTQTRRRNVTSGIGTTAQYDRKLIYRKKYMPRYKKRRWRSFIKKVNAVVDKDLGSRTVVRNDQVFNGQLMNLAGETLQAQTNLGIYGNESAAFEPLNDLRRMRVDSDLGTTGKMIFTSGIFDMTVTNTSSRQADSPNPSIRLEVDVYEITSSKDFGNVGVGTTAKTLPEVFAEGATDTANIPGTTNTLSIARRGATPWDFPSAISEYGLKILKKTKYFLNERDTFTYQIRDPKRHFVDRQKLNMDGQNMPGMTRFIYIIFRPVPGYEWRDTTPDVYRLTFGITRKYLYKIQDQTQDYDVYNS